MTKRDLDFAAQLAELERELGYDARRMLRQERHDRDGCETSPCPVCENEDRPEEPCPTA